MDTTEVLKRGRELIPEATFERMTRRIVAEHHLNADMAERIMDQAGAFLAACAVSTKPLAPSMAVDIGWHTLILHTRDYAEFCEQVAGRFIHHVPHEDEGAGETDVQDVLDQTAKAIRRAGYWVDAELWSTLKAGTCSQCKDGCADDPAPVPPFIPGEGSATD